jgi:hypothetical protein
MGTIGRYIKVIVAGALVTLVLFLIGRAEWRLREVRRERDELAAIVRMQEDTIEVRDGLYQKKVAELDAVSALLTKEGQLTASLREEVERQRLQVVSYSELVITWKRRYEALVEATQTEEPPDTPGDPVRTRVAFSKDFGPFRVDGHTLTNPPEAWVAVQQSRPIRLGVALTQAKDGRWSTLVTTEDKDAYSVDVSVSAVDRQTDVQDWRDRLSLGLDLGLYSEPRLGVSARYGDRLQLGPQCSVGASDWSCGLSVSWRPFDR